MIELWFSYLILELIDIDEGNEELITMLKFLLNENLLQV